MSAAEQGERRWASGSTLGAIVLPPLAALLLMALVDSLFPHKSASGHSLPGILVFPVAFVLLLILGTATHFAVITPLWRMHFSGAFSKARLAQYLLAGAVAGLLLASWIEPLWGVLLAVFILIQQFCKLLLCWSQIKRADDQSGPA